MSIEEASNLATLVKHLSFKNYDYLCYVYVQLSVGREYDFDYVIL